jgi:DNA polymerase-4|tara:strand:+ start:2920 stop:4008 length:1089 start_codon:yes stop_codon:yes gene_type:complete
MVDNSLPYKKIIHIDMDCFYAAVEMRENPHLFGKPIAVGGNSENRRGVLCTCNYEARKYGVRSAMPTFLALQKCPDLIVLPVRFDLYREVSQQVNEIYQRYTELIEPLSLDEAYLDVSHQKRYASIIAKEIRNTILKETGLSASAGIAASKFLAKIASDWNKPDGQLTIQPSEQEEFLKELPISKIWGVGKVTANRLYNRGIQTCGDIQKKTKEELVYDFGSLGIELWQLSRGIDNRPVNNKRPRKSLSNERTYPHDFKKIEGCIEQIPELFSELEKDLLKKDLEVDKPWKVFIKLKFEDFSTTTAESILTEPISAKPFYPLLETAWSRGKNRGVRLIGLGIRFQEEWSKIPSTQMELFESL